MFGAAFTRVIALTGNSKMTHLFGVGTWNVTSSNNPLIKVSSLINISPDRSFVLENSLMKVNGIFVFDLPKVFVKVGSWSPTVELNVYDIPSFDNVILKHGPFIYDLQRL